MERMVGAERPPSGRLQGRVRQVCDGHDAESAGRHARCELARVPGKDRRPDKAWCVCAIETAELTAACAAEAKQKENIAPASPTAPAPSQPSAVAEVTQKAAAEPLVSVAPTKASRETEEAPGTAPEGVAVEDITAPPSASPATPAAVRGDAFATATPESATPGRSRASSTVNAAYERAVADTERSAAAAEQKSEVVHEKLEELKSLQDSNKASERPQAIWCPLAPGLTAALQNSHSWSRVSRTLFDGR